MPTRLPADAWAFGQAREALPAAAAHAQQQDVAVGLAQHPADPGLRAGDRSVRAGGGGGRDAERKPSITWLTIEGEQQINA